MNFKWFYGVLQQLFGKIKATTLARFWYSKLIQIDLFSRKIHKTKSTKWGRSPKIRVSALQISQKVTFARDIEGSVSRDFLPLFFHDSYPYLGL